VEYPHTERRHLGRPAAGVFKVIDVSIAPELLVGYVDGVGDAVPAAIEQLEASVGELQRAAENAASPRRRMG